MRNNLLAALAALTIWTNAGAAVLIESSDEDGKKGRVLIDGDRARIDSGKLGGYMLLNLKEEKIYAVNHEERVIMELTSTPLTHSVHPTENSHHEPPQIDIKLLGKGPDIAGYATNKYRVSVNKSHCFDEYLAPALIKNKEIRRFVEVLAKTTRANDSSAIGLPFDEQTPCDSASELVDDYYIKYGIPLRTVDSTGLVSHKITKIDTQAAFLPGTFASPHGYQAMTREQMMKRNIESIPSHNSIEGLDMEEIIKLREQIRKQMEALQRKRSTNPHQDKAP